MRRLLIALPLLAVSVLAPAALAGGWATVGLSSTPAGTAPGEPWNVDITVLQHGRTPLEDVAADGDDPQRRRDEDVHRQADRQARRLSRVGDLPDAPGKWTYEVNDGFVDEPGAHVPGRCRSAAAAPRRRRDDQRRRRDRTCSWLRARASRCCSRPRRSCCCATAPAGSTTSLRRRESHHPRRRWPRLRGGGDDDRRLRRRRRIRHAPPPRRHAGARRRPRRRGLDRAGLRLLPHVRARERPRRRSAPTSALSLQRQDRDYVLERSCARTRTSPTNWGPGMMPERLRASGSRPRTSTGSSTYLMKARLGRLAARDRPCGHPRLRPRGLGALLRHRPERARQAAHSRRRVHRVGRFRHR